MQVRYKNSIQNLRQETRRKEATFGVVRKNERAIKMGITQTGYDYTGLMIGYHEQGNKHSIHSRVHSTFGLFKAGNFSTR